MQADYSVIPIKLLSGTWFVVCGGQIKKGAGVEAAAMCIVKALSLCVLVEAIGEPLYPGNIE